MASERTRSPPPGRRSRTAFRREVSQRIVRLGAARVWHAGERVARRAALAAAIIAADIDRVSLSGPGEALILLGIAKRRAAEMAMNLDRILLWLVSTKDEPGAQNLRFASSRACRERP